MKNTSTIKFRILFILSLLMAGYLLLLAVVHVTASNTHDHMQRISASLFPAALRIQQAETSFAQVNRSHSDAVILQDDKKLVAAEEEADKLTRNLAAVRDDAQASAEIRARSGQLLVHFTSFRMRSQRAYSALIISPDNVDQQLQTSIVSLAHETTTLTAELQALDEDVAGSFQQQLATIDSWSVRSLMTTWIMLIAALLGCASGWYVLHFRVLMPLNRLTRRMRDIAEGDGDLTGRVDVHGNDEVDQVAHWFNVFIERIEQIVLRVMHNAHGLAESSRSLSSIARATNINATEQHDQAMLITASMNDISAAVDGISRNTRKAAHHARANEQDAQASGKTLLSTIEMIQQLLSANRQTLSKIAELSHASDAIGKVIGVINDIAGQTNLLALNAAIEAARAGVHGKSFAVVAGEVRRLADRTRTATHEIDKTVSAMQAGTSEVIAAMRSSMLHVESGVSSAHAAGETLENIIKGSESVQKMVSQIAVASSEQSQATHSVNINLSLIASIIEKTTGSSAEAAEGCDRVSDLATDLIRLVNRFKVRAIEALAQDTPPVKAERESWTVLASIRQYFAKVYCSQPNFQEPASVLSKRADR